jgi:mannose-6-phosphate isomerase-like protein (cupin superfamily)
MAAPDVPVDIDVKFASIHDRWAPKIIGEINDFHLKAAKVEGEFVWHTHEDTDEFFLVRRGELTIQMRGRDDVVIPAGSFFVVPRGVEHRPIAENECEILLLEPKGVVNTGDIRDADLTADEEWL